MRAQKGQAALTGVILLFPGNFLARNYRYFANVDIEDLRLQGNRKPQVDSTSRSEDQPTFEAVAETPGGSANKLSPGLGM